MRNNICKFTLEQSNRIIGMAQAIVGQYYNWLDSERQYDLAMNTYFHLCEFNNCEVSPDPAYQVIKNTVNNRAENMRLIRCKTLKQRNLEKLTEPTDEEIEKLDEMKSGRKINNVSYESLLEDQGDLLELGYAVGVCLKVRSVKFIRGCCFNLLLLLSAAFQDPDSKPSRYNPLERQFV